jgi:hypothetical protein
METVDLEKLVGSYRQAVSGEATLKASELLVKAIEKRVTQKGIGTFVSNHEIIGVLTKEYLKLAEAVISNKIDSIKEELVSILSESFWALSSIENDSVD